MNATFESVCAYPNASFSLPLYDYIKFNQMNYDYNYYKNNRYSDFVFNYRENYYLKAIILFHISLYIFAVFAFIISYMLFLLFIKKENEKKIRGRKRRISSDESDTSDIENQALERRRSLRSYKKQKTQ